MLGSSAGFGLCESPDDRPQYTERILALYHNGQSAAMAAILDFLGWPLSPPAVLPMACGRALAPSALRRSVLCCSISPRRC